VTEMNDVPLGSGATSPENPPSLKPFCSSGASSRRTSETTCAAETDGFIEGGIEAAVVPVVEAAEVDAAVAVVPVELAVRGAAFAVVPDEAAVVEAALAVVPVELALLAGAELAVTVEEDDGCAIAVVPAGDGSGSGTGASASIASSRADIWTAYPSA